MMLFTTRIPPRRERLQAVEAWLRDERLAGGAEALPRLPDPLDHLVDAASLIVPPDGGKWVVAPRWLMSVAALYALGSAVDVDLGPLVAWAVREAARHVQELMDWDVRDDYVLVYEA